ncbi:MAG: hypothetical protein PVJ76_11230, partial [Gemmatimonadota bacterium]
MVVRIHPGQFVHPILRRSLPTLGTLLLPWAALFFPLPLQGQDPGVLSLRGASPDSAELHEEARAAQRDFEVTHRSLLKRGRDSRGGQCDEVVGRLCLSDGDPWWEPAEEDSRIVERREELLALLEQVGAQIPGDRWVIGQRIRYLGDIGRWTEAESLARTCVGPDDGWCHGLLGYVLHRSGSVVPSLEAFSRALSAMDPEMAEEWLDPYPLLEYPASRWFRNPGEIGPDGARDRFWLLADPLFLTPGNEALSEHLARSFGASLYEDTALTMGLPWGQSFEQLLLRYGFIAGWEQVPPDLGGTGVRKVVEHHHPESRGLLPPLEALEDPAGLPEGVWIPDDERPRTASAPVGAPLIARGQAQTAVFRRGENLLIVASYGVPTDTVLVKRRVKPDSVPELGGFGAPNRFPSRRPLWEPSVEGFAPDTLSGLFLVADTGSWAPLVAFGSGGRGVLQLRAPPGGYLLSLEQWCPAGRWGARVRHGVRGEALPVDVPHLSDLVLLDRGDELPTSLAEAAPRMRPSTGL